MDQPHRAGQLDLVGLDQDHLALDAAQFGLGVARGEPAAIDHDAVEFGGGGLAVELDGAAGGDDPGVQLRQHPARLDMALAGEEQRIAETALERGFEFGQSLRVEPPVARCELGKTLEIGAVAAVRHHQRAVERGIRQFAAPQIERPQAEPGDDGFGGLALAPRRQHAAGPVAGGEHHRRVAALVQRDVVAGLREQQRLPGAGNAGADDGNGGISPDCDGQRPALWL